jgi:2-methylisocitrate lyase-like PEP mutase family enzyme
MDISRRVLSRYPGSMNQAEKAALLRQLHHGPSILRLCNVWDAASARIVEEAGFPAIATSSAGVAFSLGYPDVEAIPAAEMLTNVGRIVRVVTVPVTADLEAGYEDIERTAAGLVEAGAVGLNLEDFQNGKLVNLAAQIEKIHAVRRVGERLGVPIVINARTDIYLAQLGDAATRFERSVERLLAYRDAGADCLFVPGVYDQETIAALVKALQFPLNILATAGALTVDQLQQLGVARVSLGSGPMRATMGLIRRIAEEFRDSGMYNRMLEAPVTYSNANELMRNVARTP